MAISEYEKSLKLLSDIEKNGLQLGGEQYPNAQCALEQGLSLKRETDQMESGPEQDSAKKLSETLIRFWTDPNFEAIFSRNVAKNR